MSDFPDTTIKVTSMAPCGGTKVCIQMELVVDVHRLAEVGSDMLHAAIEKMNEGDKKR